MGVLLTNLRVFNIYCSTANTGEVTRAFHIGILTPVQAVPPALEDSVPSLFPGLFRNPDPQPGKQTPPYSEQDPTAPAGPNPHVFIELLKLKKTSEPKLLP